MKKDVTVKSPRQVQKSFKRITVETGTPASSPKPRGKPLGRLKGSKQVKRERHPIVLKKPKPPKMNAA